MKIWFLMNDGQVSGPFEPAEIESLLGQAKNPQIWGRGQPDWQTPDKWRKFVQSQPATPAAPPASQQIWSIRVDGKELPPTTYDGLIRILLKMTDLSSVYVKTENTSGWREIYAVQEIVDDLGVTRRAHPRVPIMGNLTCEAESGTFVARAVSISEGGLGINNTAKMKIGDKFRGTLQSPNLFMTIEATCEVVFIGKEGFAGVRFIGLPHEAKSSIIEYVNKFAMN